MSRRLQGRKSQTSAGWEASLPEARGATKRVRHVFGTEEAADQWISLAKADIENGRPLTVPTPQDLADTGRRKTAPSGTSFRVLGDKWIVERYEELGRAKLRRQKAAAGHVSRISAWMEDRGLTFETMVREEVKAFQRSLTRHEVDEVGATVPDGLDPNALLSIKEALALPEMTASLSTLKRRIKDGVLVPASTSPAGHRYFINDLFSRDNFCARPASSRKSCHTGGSEVVCPLDCSFTRARRHLEQRRTGQSTHERRAGDDRSFSRRTRPMRRARRVLQRRRRHRRTRSYPAAATGSHDAR